MLKMRKVDEACSHETPHRLFRLSLRMLTLALDGV